MSRFRYRHHDEESIGQVLLGAAIGALAGFAAGVIVAQKVGGIAGIRARLKERVGALADDEPERELYDEDEFEEDELEEHEHDTDAALEARVLEAFRRDPVLSERAIDIGALGERTIELSGWVDSEAEVERATRVARSVPEVDAVVNQLLVGEQDDMDIDDTDDIERDASDADADADADDTNEPLPGGRWEGQRVGTGRRRQGTSDEADRHADPKPELEERWLDEQHAIEEAAGPIEGVAERRRGRKSTPKGDRTRGGPVAPGGVPKGDHVADPEAAKDLPPKAD